MKKNHIIILIIVLVLAVIAFWFRMNYQIVEIPEQVKPLPTDTIPEITELTPTTHPGIDPTTESKGPTYPPPSYPGR